MNNTDPDMKDNNKGESSEVNSQELEKRLNLSIVAMIKSPTVTIHEEMSESDGNWKDFEIFKDC